ncbi:unnamed protein product [Paramecium pentaurelia]|uniref:Uncharacterized protein n=1 Tax=Paramecium pentaurelia TaxID=43138 RepID=A0A8S1XUE3_9CILI|nr:unnamed protein product [Paramecium pentaurelia]
MDFVITCLINLDCQLKIYQTQIKEYHQFNLQTEIGIVLIKNFISSGLICHPSCQQGWGSLPNQYSQCCNQMVQLENTCINPCPAKIQFLTSQQGCKSLCSLDQLFYNKVYFEYIQGIIEYDFACKNIKY